MKKIILVALLFQSLISYASPYVEDLQKCLTQSTSEKDVIVLVRWFAKAISAHPNLSDISNIDEKKKVEIDKKFASYVTRLVTDDCKKEFDNVTKYEGSDAMGVAFRFLGQSSTVQLMKNKGVNSAIVEFAKYMK